MVVPDRDLEAEKFPIELELDREQQYIASTRNRICVVKTCTKQAVIAHGYTPACQRLGVA